MERSDSRRMSWQGTWNGALCRRRAGIQGTSFEQEPARSSQGAFEWAGEGLHMRPELRTLACLDNLSCEAAAWELPPGCLEDPGWAAGPGPAPRIFRPLLFTPSVLFNPLQQKGRPPPASSLPCMDLIISVTSQERASLVSSLRVSKGPGAETPDSPLCSSSFPQRRGGSGEEGEL